jgi:hypothetical protein
VVAIELQGQLLARERELDSREGIIAAWEDGLVAFECALGKVHVKCNVSHVRAEAVQQDFSAQSCASSSRSKRLTDLNWTLEEHQILFCLQEADLEMQEAILVEEKAHSLHPPTGGTYWRNWKRPTCAWMRSMMSTPSRPDNYRS